MKRPMDMPHGFILSDAALYSFKCQDVFPDIVSFAAAIPDHLKPLFLIPIQLETITASVAAKIAAKKTRRLADGATPTGDTPEGDLFSYQTFKSEDNEPTVPSSDPGSIFKMDDADDLTHHQEFNFDENIQAPTDTSYMSDIDTTQYFDYPYRSKEEPRHSSIIPRSPIITKLHLALKPEDLVQRIPEKIDRNSKTCSVSLVSYDKKNRVFTFAVDAGHGAKDVKASLSDIDEVALSCNCPFWRYNGPEFHASENKFMLGQPYGTAAPPNIRDPERKYWLCKHAAAALKRLDYFVQEIVEENWDLDEDELMEQVDEQWDRLEGTVEVPEEALDEEEGIDVDVDWDTEPEGGLEPEPAEPHPPEEEEEAVEDELPSYDVDLSELEEPVAEEHPVDYEAPEEEAEAEAEGEPEIEVDYEAPEEEPEAEEPEETDYEAPEEEAEEEEEPEEEEAPDYSGEEEEQEQ